MGIYRRIYEAEIKRAFETLFQILLKKVQSVNAAAKFWCGFANTTDTKRILLSFLI